MIKRKSGDNVNENIDLSSRISDAMHLAEVRPRKIEHKQTTTFCFYSERVPKNGDT